MLEDIVGEACALRQRSSAGAGDAGDRERIEVGDPVIAPGTCLVGYDGLAAAAEMSEHSDPARPPAQPGEQLGDYPRGAAILRQDQDAALRREM